MYKNKKGEASLYVKPGIIKRCKRKYPIGIEMQFDMKTWEPISAHFFVSAPVYQSITAYMEEDDIQQLMEYYKIDIKKLQKALKLNYEANIPLVYIFCDNQGNTVIDYSYGIDE